MSTETRITKVKFIDSKLFEAYQSLKSGTFEEKNLAAYLDRAFADLKENPFAGIKLPSRLWPKDYAKYHLSNLRKYDLPNAWRLTYTLEGNELEIVSIILEWFSHKEYEKRFKYNVK